MIRNVLPESLGEMPLQTYLRRAWPLLSGHMLRNLLKARDVRVNGVRMQRDQWVRGGDVLEIYAQSSCFEPLPELLFNDGRLLVCVKPQGLPALPDRDGIGADTMEERLKRVHPDARLLHRLDAATGGVMLAAADEQLSELLLSAFKAHTLRKRYRAVLCARPPRDEMSLQAYLQKDARRASVRVLDHASRDAKEIETRLHVMSSPGQGLCMAELEPITGRTHQLRAHMAHIHCPILGDDKYGDRARNRELGFVGKLCLWCESMCFPEDASFETYAGMRFQAPAPDWIQG